MMALLDKKCTTILVVMTAMLCPHVLALTAPRIKLENPLSNSIKAFLLRPATKAEDDGFKSTNHIAAQAVNDVVSVARQNGATKFSDFVLKTSWLASTLVNSTGNVTVFAFSDNAYKESSTAVKAALANTDHPGSRDMVLQYHVAIGRHYEKEIASGVDKRLSSLFPSPPLSLETPFQPIHVGAYWIYDEWEKKKMIVTASGATIVKSDLQASNGIVHIIDKVMFPIPTGSDMVQYLREEPKYSQLYDYLEKANLTSALSTSAFQPLTLFAPNDDAFDKLSKSQQKYLNNTANLIKVLTYHVVEGSYYSAAMYLNLQLRSLQGSTIYFDKGVGGISAEGQLLVSLDTTVTNGVIQELSGVMFPGSMERFFRET